MRTKFLPLVALCIVTCFAPRQLEAQIDAACCRCGTWYQISPTGAGFARHHVGFCPKCTAEMGGDVSAYLDRLHGRMQGLTDAAQLTLARLRESIAARDAARDSIFGRKGSATGFFSALLGLAAEGTGGVFKKVASGVKTGLSTYNKAADTLEGNVGWVLDEGKDWIKDKTVGEAKKKAMLKGAAVAGRRYFEQSGDARGATQQFLQAHGDIKKGVSVLESAITFYEKTDALANGIQKYLEERANAARLWDEWNATMDEVQKIQDEVTKLEECLRKQQEQNPINLGDRVVPHRRLSGGEGAGARMFLLAAAGDAELRAQVRTLVFPPNEPDAAALESAATTLVQLRTMADDFQRNLAEDVVPPLLPFWVGVQEDLGRDFGRALLQWAEPATEQAARQYDRLMRWGEGIREELRRAGAQPDGV